MINRKKIFLSFIALLIVFSIYCSKIYTADVNYSLPENWAYFAVGGKEKSADLFLICPTVDTKDETNMSLSDEGTKRKFIGALNMQRGIYEDSTRMYAPYYRQITLKMLESNREKYIQTAYKDISAAFTYYMKNENQGRPIILAGFSQGADMCQRLLKEYFEDGEIYKQLVAVYAIGCPCTEKYNHVKPAQSEKDFGVIISFECESPNVTETIVYPAGRKSIAINPLNWRTDETPADKSQNLGACFTNYSGEINKEIKNFCGGYIDSERGVVKITDINPDDYPPAISLLPKGAYHIYDYQFFFRNLQQNVKERIKSYMEVL